jgi:hypothetical protein
VGLKKSLLVSALMLGLFFAAGAEAQLKCEVKSSPCGAGEVDVFHMNQTSDSHAEIPTWSNYVWKVCCRNAPGLNDVQQGVRYEDYDVVLKLYREWDSHVQNSSETGYNYYVNISVDRGGMAVICNYSQPGGDCDEFGWDYACLATMNQSNNSHVSDCDGVDDFAIKICCKAEADADPPVIQITEPSFEWTNLYGFTIVWSGDDGSGYGVSGLKWYNVTYRTDPSGAWIPWGSGGDSYTSDTFGYGRLLLLNGSTYYINVTATDWEDNQASDVINVTIDRTPPVIYIKTLDQDGNPIPSQWIPPGSPVTLVNVTSNVSDERSGVEKNTIEYVVSGEDSRHEWLECGSGPSPGWSICSTADSSQGRLDIRYSETTSIRYRVIARDRAGNENISRYYFSVSHPLANFERSSYYITMGESMLVPVYVRNIQDRADRIDVNLTASSYPHAHFEHDCEASECIISPDRRGINIFSVNPNEERIYHVRVLSGEPGEYTIGLEAFSEINASLMDSHTTSITMGYPAEFPGLCPWAVALLLALAGLAYGALSRRQLQP